MYRSDNDRSIKAQECNIRKYCSKNLLNRIKTAI